MCAMLLLISGGESAQILWSRGIYRIKLIHMKNYSYLVINCWICIAWGLGTKTNILQTRSATLKAVQGHSCALQERMTDLGSKKALDFEE